MVPRWWPCLRNWKKMSEVGHRRKKWVPEDMPLKDTSCWGPFLVLCFLAKGSRKLPPLHIATLVILCQIKKKQSYYGTNTLKLYTKYIFLPLSCTYNLFFHSGTKFSNTTLFQFPQYLHLWHWPSFYLCTSFLPIFAIVVVYHHDAILIGILLEKVQSLMSESQCSCCLFLPQSETCLHPASVCSVARVSLKLCATYSPQE